jgi:hypothetical protein
MIYRVLHSVIDVSVSLLSKLVFMLKCFSGWLGLPRTKKRKKKEKNFTKAQEADDSSWKNLPYQIIQRIFGKSLARAIFAQSVL